MLPMRFSGFQLSRRDAAMDAETLASEYGTAPSWNGKLRCTLVNCGAHCQMKSSKDASLYELAKMIPEKGCVLDFVAGEVQMARNDQLIYDVGLHRGEDTEYYLKKGYRVVAFEANPVLVELCRDRFTEELRSGQLHIVAGAIAPPTDTGKVSFYVNQRTTVWGTIDLDWVKRNDAAGAESKIVEVDRVDITEVLRKFGVPFYLKIDIEGADGLVLSALREFTERPQFVSIEANTVNLSLMEQDLETLRELGYKRFQLVPQGEIRGSRVHTETLQGRKINHVFSGDASGAFGDDLNGVWVDRDAIVASFTPTSSSWQDIHASLSVDERPNLALNRPAKQSSTSRWSTDQSPERDARVANNGDLVAQTFFHTAVELNPWWQVDLGDVFVVEKVILYNRVDVKNRLNKFTILRSVDGNEWFSLFKKTDDASFETFSANIIERGLARFVRVRLDGQNCLHFRECQIFGRHPGPYELEGLRTELAAPVAP